jgi:hypothetical protein
MKMTRDELAAQFFGPVYCEDRGASSPRAVAVRCYALADEFLAESLGRTAAEVKCPKLAAIRAILEDSPRYAAEMRGVSGVARAYDRLVEQLEEVLEDE